MAAMAVRWDGFNLNTPDWNALYYIDEMLRQSRQPHYEVLTVQRTHDPNGPNDNGPKIIAFQDNDQLVVAIVCVALAAHTTWTTIIVSGNDDSACDTEKGNLTNQIVDMGLN
jgi:hypothetical protein